MLGNNFFCLNERKIYFLLEVWPSLLHFSNGFFQCLENAFCLRLQSEDAAGDGHLNGDLIGVGHGESIKDFLRLGKENFARAGFSVQLLRLHSATRTLTSKRIAEEPTPRKIFFHF